MAIIAHAGRVIARDFMTSYPSGEPAWKPGIEIPSNSVIGLQWNNSVTELIAFLSWLRNTDGSHSLVMPFLPCSRQDKFEWLPGGDQSAGVRVILDLLQFAPFKHLTIVDNHSVDVLGVWPSHRLNHITLASLVSTYARSNGGGNYDLVVAPDRGAVKRAAQVASALGVPRIVNANKVRDQASGRITSYQLDVAAGEHKNILVVDDILDGGYTFKLLSREISRLWPDAKRTLLCTHGVLSPMHQEITDDWGREVSCERNYHHFVLTDSCSNADAFARHMKTGVAVLPILERLTIERSLVACA